MAIVGLGGEKLWLCPSLNDNPHDISGNGNNGTYNGGMGTVADTSNGGTRAYSFDGVDDYVETPFILNPASGDFSCTCWAMLNSSASSIAVISQQLGSGGRAWLYRDGNALASYLGGTLTSSANHFTHSTYGVFQHFALVYSGSTLKLYVNGTEESSAAVTAESEPSSGMKFGSGKTTYYWDGLIDDIRIFDRALTTAEIKHLAKARGITGTPLKKGLGDEKLWLCPSIDDSAEDLSGNGNNGTYNGGMGTVADSSNGGSRAYSFNGVNQAISLTSTDIQQITTTGSFSAWVYLDTSVTSGFRTIFDRSTLWTPGTIALSYAAGFDRLEFVTNTNGDDGLARYTITPANFTGQWWHVCGVLDGGNATLFLNGSQVAQDSTDAVPTTSTSQFVGATNITQSEWVGKIDDIRVFTRALTPTEITHLASARGVAGSPYGFEGLGGEKLWLCPTLDDSAEDISGNRHHGTYIAGMGTVADTSNGGTRAYSFNGTTHMLDVDSPPSITGPSASITYWCKSNDFVSWRSPGGYVTNGYDDYRLTFRKSNQYLVVGYARYSTGGTRATDYYSLNNFSYTDWTHYAVVANEGDVYFYVDGVLAATGTGGSGGLDLGSTFTLGSQDLRVGGSWWNGYIDDCRVYDRAITQEEVTHLAKSRGVLGSPHNLNGIVHLLSSFIHPFT